MGISRVNAHRAASTIADALGLAHFFAVNVIMLLGRYTTLFDFMGEGNPGYRFVVAYIDKPVYLFLSAMFTIPFDGAKMWIFAEMVFVMASLLYGLACYAVVRAYLTFFDLGK